MGGERSTKGNFVSAFAVNQSIPFSLQFFRSSVCFYASTGALNDPWQHELKDKVNPRSWTALAPAYARKVVPKKSGYPALRVPPQFFIGLHLDSIPGPRSFGRVYNSFFH